MGESYRDLIASQKAMHLVTDIYDATRAFPSDRAVWTNESAQESCCLRAK